MMSAHRRAGRWPGWLHSMIGAGRITGTAIVIAHSAAASRGAAILPGSFPLPRLITGVALSNDVTLCMVCLFLPGTVDAVDGTVCNTLNQLAVDATSVDR